MRLTQKSALSGTSIFVFYLILRLLPAAMGYAPVSVVSRQKLSTFKPNLHAKLSRSNNVILTNKLVLYSTNSFREDAFSQELEQVEAQWGIEHTHHQNYTFHHHNNNNNYYHNNLNGTTSVAIVNNDNRKEHTTTTTIPTSTALKPMKVRNAAAIVAGTAVGGGFLALPSFTSPIGYLPTVLGLTASWGFLVFAAIAFCEAAALQDDCAKLEGMPKKQHSGTSVASVIKFTFGKKWALLAGAAFLAQMIAVMTANVVKGAELVAFSTGMPYWVACIVPATLIGAFTFGGAAQPERVEQVNAAMTVMMVGGFATLIASAIGGGYTAGTWKSLVQNSNWARLLPTTQFAWAVPIFVKLLAFGEAMPLIVQRMALTSSDPPNEGDGSNNNQSATDKLVRMTGFRNIRKATVLGAAVPLLLAIIWAGISGALVDPTSPNPMLSLLEYGPSIALPVFLLSYGAIGTTLLGAFLAMGHFCQDMICSKFGYCSIPWMNTANVLTVLIPCALALFGSSLYLPLLAFAGAYPTTLLYGLAPSLAAMTLRNRAQKRMEDGAAADISITPHLLPGGKRTLMLMAATALGLVGASTLRAGRAFVQAMP